MKQKNSLAVIGLGFVGLPLAILFARKGYKVYGFDVDQLKVQKINNRLSYITDVVDSDLKEAIDKFGFKALLPSAKIRETPYIVVTVPTPYNEKRNEPDLRFVIQASEFIANNLMPNQTIIFESSTYPGTLEEVILPILSQSGLRVGKDFFLGYSPERIDPGNKNYTIDQIPKIVSGQTESCKQKVIDFYGKVFKKIVPVSSPKVAEMAKIFENTQRLVNISLVNEIELICQKMGINFREAIEAAATKPFGFTPYYPGPGIGGHCIPVDPLYFQWKADKLGLASELVKVAHEINKAIPLEIIKHIKDQLGLVPQQNKSILLVGLTYKKDVEDIRESPALTILELLLNEAIDVNYHDPLIPNIMINNQTYTSTPLTPETIKQHDIVVILTDHSIIDWNILKNNAAILIDTRGVIRKT